MNKNKNTKNEELLLKDLCNRLPYGVKCDIGDDKPYTLNSISNNEDGILVTFKEKKNGLNVETYISEVKPYLFPLSSMTEEQTKEYYATIRPIIMDSLDEYQEQENFQKQNSIEKEFPITLKHIKCDVVSINWMLEHHFDVNDILSERLAKNAAELKVY